MVKPELTIVIPTYNEADLIESSLMRIGEALGDMRSRTEIIIADDGSDDLPAVIDRCRGSLGFAAILVMRNETPLGKGGSIARAFRASSGVVVGFIDVDLSVAPSYIREAVREIKEGNDICIAKRVGNRFKSDGSLAISIVATVFAFVHSRLIFGRKRSFADTQCGFKFFKNAVALRLYEGLVATDGLTDLEVLLKAVRLDYKVVEIEVPRKNDRIGKRRISSIFVSELLSLCRIFCKHKLAPGMASVRHFIEKHRYLFIILFLGIIIQLGTFATLKSISADQPESLHHMFPIMGGGFDSTHYSTLPDNILDYGNFSLQPGSDGNPETFRTPAYPFFVAMIKYLTGGIDAVPIFQTFLLAIGAYLGYFISLSVAPLRRRVALAVAACFMIDPVSFFATQFLATESLYTVLFLAGIYFLVGNPRPRIWAFALSGLFYGLSALTRPSGLYTIVPIGLWMIWHIFRAENRRAMLIGAGVFCLAGAILIVPWYIRNGVRTGVYSFSSLEAYNMLNFNLPVYLSYESGYKLSIEDVRADMHKKIGGISDDEQLDLRNSPMMKQVIWKELEPRILSYGFFHLSKSLNFFFSPGTKLDASILRGFWEQQPIEDWHPQTSLVNSLIDGRPKDVLAWLGSNKVYFPESLLLVCLFLLGLYWSIASRSNNARLLFGLILFLGILTSPITNPRYRAPIVPFVYLCGFMGAAMLIERARQKKRRLILPSGVAKMSSF